MNNSLLLGLWKFLIRVPQSIWQRRAASGADSGRSRLAFMSSEHHLVRNFVVLELPRRGRPIQPDEIARELKLPYKRVQEILGELEKGLTFLFRNPQGNVAWAYPVTVEPTPHRVHFSSGEDVYAA